MVFKKRYRRIRRVGFGKRVSRRTRSFMGGGLMGDVKTFASGAAYGYARPMLSNLVTPLSNKLPIGDAADNVACGIALMLVKKFIKMPLISKVADAGLAVEGAMLGQELKGGMTGSTTSGSLW